MASNETTKDELMERARELDIDGRSKMDKNELAAAIAAVEDQSNTLEKAQAIKAWLDEHPDQHDLEQIVEGSGVDLAHARPILDSWRPDGSEAGVSFVGPGQGGPWVEAAPMGYLTPEEDVVEEEN